MIEKEVSVNWSLKTFGIVLSVCAVVVGIYYRFIDKPAVFFAHAHGLRDYRFLHWIQQIPNVLFPLIPLTLVYLAYKFYKKSLTYFDRFVFHLVLSLILITVLKYPVKYFFARHWPSTFCDNLSLLGHGAYGFSFFNIGKAYEAFPSGNAAMIFAAAAVSWIYYPRWRWLGGLTVLLSVTGVVGLYYHFVSDVVAGGFLGIMLAVVALRFKFKFLIN